MGIVRAGMGGNLCVLSLDDGSVRELAPQLAGGLFDRYDLSFDGSEIVFGYTKSVDEGLRLWRIGVDGSGLRQITVPRDCDTAEARAALFPEWDKLGQFDAQGKPKPDGGYGGQWNLSSRRFLSQDFHPCWLPDGGIVFASTRAELTVLCGGTDLTVPNLYRIEPDGNGLRRLSHTILNELCPSVLNDGRIIYNRWEYVFKSLFHVQPLWSMYPDGGRNEAIYGNVIGEPGVFIQGRAVPGHDNLIVCTGASHEKLAVGPILLVDCNKDKRSYEAMRSLTPEVQVRGIGSRWFKREGEVVQRNTVEYPYTGGEATSARRDRACGYLSWADLCAFAAWAGLRPMTELEYEKACRGPQTPVADEYAWGTATIMGTTQALSGAENGTETVTSSTELGGCSYGRKEHTGGDAGNGWMSRVGPLRVGIFATNGASRVSAGASYWGIMDLSGNVWERAVTVANATGRAFTGLHGNGVLNASGDADVTGWPDKTCVGGGFRGGSCKYPSARARVSDRYYATVTDQPRFDTDNGGRAVRSAPSGVGPQGEGGAMGIGDSMPAAGSGRANSLVVKNVTVAPRDSTTAYVTFDIAWDNSWRNAINHDAAWVFFKVQPEGATTWNHVALAANQELNPTGYSFGPGTALDFIVPKDKVGMFVRRHKSGIGAVASTNVRAIWDFTANGLTKNTKVKIQAFGLEMVYVAEGTNTVGDGSVNTIKGQFEAGTSGKPFAITNEADPITLGGGGAGSLGDHNASPTKHTSSMYNGGDDFNNKTSKVLPSAFPKGYAAFYCMKYEITEGQWVDFFNTLTAAQKTERDITGGPGDNWQGGKNGKMVQGDYLCTGPLFGDPWPLSDKFFLVAHNPDKPMRDKTAYGIWLIDAFGNRVPIYKDPAISCWEPMPLQPRHKPPVLATTGGDPAAEGTLFMQNVYEGLDRVGPGAVKYLRVIEQVPRAWDALEKLAANDQKAFGSAPAVTRNLHIFVERLLGIVPVREDGSACFTVPAERNIFLQALDKDFMQVQTMRTIVNLQPGETRSCIGCHEDRRHTPDTRGVAASALRQPPLRPEAQPGDATATRSLHYATDVQPVFDKHCVSCHAGDASPKAKAKLNLSGELTEFFSRSYEELLDKGYVKGVNEWQTGNPNWSRAAHGGDNEITAVPRPYSQGSRASKLINVLRNNHQDVKLSQGEFVKLVTWVDLNLYYYGSYYGKRNLSYQGDPDFRPVPTQASEGSK